MSKPYDPEDPCALVGTPVPEGDFDEMAFIIVEEFVRLGVDDAKLWRIFRSPIYDLTHAILSARGEEYVQDLIDRARARWGHPRFTERGAPDA
ncbi:MAG: hypothetical protein ACE5JR_11525 [Gemmatimonadota bacterium]